MQSNYAGTRTQSCLLFDLFDITELGLHDSGKRSAEVRNGRNHGMQVDDNGKSWSLPAPWRHTVVLGLSVVVGCAFNLLVQPIGRDWSLGTESLLLGVIDAQPAMVAIWMAFTPWQFSRRISIGLFVMLLLAAALSIGIRWDAANGYSHQAVVHATTFVISSLMQFMLLATVRRAFGWQLAIPSHRSDQRPAKTQFAISAVFIWTLEVAAFSMLLHYLAKISRDDEMPVFGFETLAWATRRSLLITGLTAPCLTFAWLLLSGGKARWIGGLLTVLALAASAQLGYAVSFGMSNRELMWGTAMYSLGMLLCSLIVIGVFKALGFRLIRISL